MTGTHATDPSLSGTQDAAYVAHDDEKPVSITHQIEDIKGGYHDDSGNMIYDDVDVEPAIHWRTQVAFLAVWLLNFTFSQTTAGAPSLVSDNLPCSCVIAW